MSEDLSLRLPAELIDSIADAVRQRLADEPTASPWLDRKAAAEYLSVPVSRLEKDKTVPVHHWDGRVLYHRGELDEFIRGG